MSQGPKPISTPPPLEYSARPKLAWIGRHGRKLIVYAICIAIATSLYEFGQPLKHRVLWIYWSHQAALYKMPDRATDAIISDPLGVKTVPTTNPQYTTVAPSGRAPWAVYSPLVYRQLFQFDSRLNLVGDATSVLLFIGTRRRPDGTPRLVVVTGGTGIAREMLTTTRVVVLPLPGWFDPLPPASSFGSGGGRTLSIIGPPPTRTQLRTGVADSKNLSHIVFEFSASSWSGRGFVPGGGGTIDAFLKNDDSLSFSLRSSWGIRENVNLGTTSIVGDVKTLERAGQTWLQSYARLKTASVIPSTQSSGRIGK